MPVSHTRACLGPVSESAFLLMNTWEAADDDSSNWIRATDVGDMDCVPSPRYCKHLDE